MQESKNLVVDGVKYISTMYSPTKGWPLFGKLVQFLGPAVAEGFDGFSGDVAKIGPKMLGSLFVSMKPEDLVPTLTELFSTTQIHDDKGIRPIIFDQDFRGGYVHAVKLAKEVVEFQYEDFWNAIKDMLGDNPLVAGKQSIG